ncbi:MAG: aminoacyl-tRNA deacylase, partial [Chloroflexi bacterium]|nr:aminoacyl-tRNA deacylase [Chloroflexota bacterium]
MIRNNVTRLLDSRKIQYEAYEFPGDEKRSAGGTAVLIGVPPEIVYKTIVVARETKGKPILCMVPATGEVNLKKLAAALGEKKLRLPTQREAETITGLQAGGISPLALLNKGFQVCLDRSAERHPHIHISGGRRGLNLRLAVNDLVALTGAKWVEA